MIPICEKLRACNIEFCENLPVGYGPPVNPDGPEAADTIEELVEALAEAAATFRHYERLHQSKVSQVMSGLGPVDVREQEAAPLREKAARNRAPMPTNTKPFSPRFADHDASWRAVFGWG